MGDNFSLGEKERDLKLRTLSRVITVTISYPLVADYGI